MKTLLMPSQKIETQIVTIHPEVAQNLLDNSDMSIQRKINHKQVKFLTREILKGNWSLNGDAIRQDIKGNIIDGQHRLKACIMANKSIETLFVKGLPTESIVTIDMGQKSRSNSDVLEMTRGEKYKYSSNISAAAKFINKFEHNSFSTNGNKADLNYKSGRDYLDWINSHEDIFESVADSMRIRSNGDKLISANVFCGLKYIFDNLNKEKSNLFFQQISDGYGLKPTDTIFTFRKKIINHKSQSNRITQKAIVLLICRCWNAFIKGERLTYLRVPSEMPKLLK